MRLTERWAPSSRRSTRPTLPRSSPTAGHRVLRFLRTLGVGGAPVFAITDLLLEVVPEVHMPWLRAIGNTSAAFCGCSGKSAVLGGAVFTCAFFKPCAFTSAAAVPVQVCNH